MKGQLGDLLADAKSVGADVDLAQMCEKLNELHTHVVRLGLLINVKRRS